VISHDHCLVSYPVLEAVKLQLPGLPEIVTKPELSVVRSNELPPPSFPNILTPDNKGPLGLSS